MPLPLDHSGSGGGVGVGDDIGAGVGDSAGDTMDGEVIAGRGLVVSGDVHDKPVMFTAFESSPKREEL